MCGGDVYGFCICDNKLYCKVGTNQNEYYRLLIIKNDWTHFYFILQELILWLVEIENL